MLVGGNLQHLRNSFGSRGRVAGGSPLAFVQLVQESRTMASWKSNKMWFHSYLCMFLSCGIVDSYNCG